MDSKITLRNVGRLNGKCIYGKTIADCQAKTDGNEKMPIKGNFTLNDWFPFYVKIFRGKLKESSRINLIKSYNSNIVNAIGKDLVMVITAEKIRDFLDGLKSTNRQRCSYKILKDMYAKMMDMDEIDSNPMKFIDMRFADDDAIEDEEENAHFLTDEQARDLFLALKNHDSKFYNISEFIFYSGMRKGEALALTWGDIDLNKRQIRINKAYNSTTGKIQTPKTISSIRTIPLFDGIEQVLARIPKGEKGDHIFKNVDSISYSSSFKEFCRKNLSITASPHTLRHTFASRCFAAGIDLKIISAWLGHSSIKITADIYISFTQDRAKIEAVKIKALTL